MRIGIAIVLIAFSLLPPASAAARQTPKPEIPFAASLNGWPPGRQYLFLSSDDVPHGRANRISEEIIGEEALRAYFDANHKQVTWVDPGVNVIVLDTRENRGYARVLMIESGDAGKIGWLSRKFVHRSKLTLTGQPNTDRVNGAAMLIAYDAKDRRIYSVTYAESHGMHDAGGDLLVEVPMSLLPAEARLSRAMHGKLD